MTRADEAVLIYDSMYVCMCMRMRMVMTVCGV